MEALSRDVKCFEAFEMLVGGEMMTSEEEWDFIQSLPFHAQTDEDAEFIRMMYTVRLKKVCLLPFPLPFTISDPCSCRSRTRTIWPSLANASPTTTLSDKIRTSSSAAPTSCTTECVSASATRSPPSASSSLLSPFLANLPPPSQHPHPPSLTPSHPPSPPLLHAPPPQPPIEAVPARTRDGRQRAGRRD
jgi:hypothetical protein